MNGNLTVPESSASSPRRCWRSTGGRARCAAPSSACRPPWRSTARRRFSRRMPSSAALVDAGDRHIVARQRHRSLGRQDLIDRAEAGVGAAARMARPGRVISFTERKESTELLGGRRGHGVRPPRPSGTAASSRSHRRALRQRRVDLRLEQFLHQAGERLVHEDHPRVRAWSTGALRCPACINFSISSAAVGASCCSRGIS